VEIKDNWNGNESKAVVNWRSLTTEKELVVEW